MTDAVVIRPLRADDAADLLAVRHQPGVLAGTLNILSKRLQDLRHEIEELGSLDHELVAEIDGRVVGTARLVAYEGRMNHVGEIVHIMVHDEFQSRSIGRQLLQALLAIADNDLGLVRVELLVYADNEGAVRLYEGLGFDREGVKRKCARRQGQLVDALAMARIR